MPAMSPRHVHASQNTGRSLDPGLDFMRLLWSIQNALQRRSKKMEGDLGITGPQRLVLRVVGRFPGISASELAAVVHLHPSTITGVLQRLVAKGWLERRLDPTDTRRVQLLLKPSGVVFTRTARGTIERDVTDALAHVGKANVRAARKVLGEIARRLGDV
jgi:DNA-binding MarR family transcriptional regulator